MLSGRIPIVPAFRVANTHLGGQAFDLVVSDVFDLVGLSETLDTPIVELNELKTIGALDPRRQPIIYDGEFPQNGKDGKPLQVGDAIAPEWDGGDQLYCWSYWQSRGHNGLKSTSMGSTSELSPTPTPDQAESSRPIHTPTPEHLSQRQPRPTQQS